ncbi:hypothetical protein ACFE04_004307 [Oxalis oulophora]
MDMDSLITRNLHSLGSFAAAAADSEHDPCFILRAAAAAARFSSEEGGGFNNNISDLSQMNGMWSSMLEDGGGGDDNDSMEHSTVSEQLPTDGVNRRKRKVVARGKANQTTADCKVAAVVENDQSNAKRSKTEQLKRAKEEAKNGGEDSSNTKQDKENSKPEPLKDYIHVRARRGQATDSHSLAERVRREKISERMKFLQDLVPGCNKVTGKAVMLDEIINYVQSLQHQVEFLSMKLATVNPTIHYNLEPALSKDMFHYREALSHAHYQQHQQGLPTLHGNNNAAANQFAIPLNGGGGLQKNAGFQMLMPRVDGLSDVIHQGEGGLWEDDLQSVIQMGFGGHNEAHNIHGSMRNGE